jgi:hypothetical protein
VRIASDYEIVISFDTGFTVQNGTEWAPGPGTVKLVGPVKGGNRPMMFKYKGGENAEEQTWNVSRGQSVESEWLSWLGDSSVGALTRSACSSAWASCPRTHSSCCPHRESIHR